MRSAYFMFPPWEYGFASTTNGRLPRGQRPEQRQRPFGVGASMTHVQSAAEGRSGTTYASGRSQARDRHSPETRESRLARERHPLILQALQKTGATGLEPATSGVTGRRSNQLNYAPRRSGV